jgi:hypothetical protein
MASSKTLETIKSHLRLDFFSGTRQPQLLQKLPDCINGAPQLGQLPECFRM